MADPNIKNAGVVLPNVKDGVNLYNYNYHGEDSRPHDSPKPLPRIISTHPLTPPPCFTGRDDVLETIAKSLTTHHKASLCGISGLGKSSVVLEYAERNIELYRHVVFARVLGGEQFDLNIKQLCEGLGISLGPEDADDEKKAKKLREQIINICDGLADGELLLLILDNVDEPGRLRPFLPGHPRLHLLLTSNFQSIHAIGHEVEIGNLSEDEAALLLYRLGKDADAENTDDLDGAELNAVKEIVALFGFHPLAISIAGNYINSNKKSFSRYLSRLKESKGRILKHATGVDAYQFPDIYSAFDIAFTAICDADGKADEEQMQISIARECMKIASLLAPDEMPEEVFWETAGLLNDDWKVYLADEDNRDAVYQRLSQYQLFDRDGESSTFSIHRLVRLFLADRLEEEREGVEEPLAEVLSNNFEKFNFSNKVKVERYLPHVGVYLEYFEAVKSETKQNLKLENRSTALLCNRFARYFEQYGDFRKAEKYYGAFRDICDGDKGIDESLRAGSYNNLALLYKSQGRYEEAEPLYKRAAEIHEKVMGEEHTSTAINYNNLAGLYESQGRYDEAEPLYKRALAINEKVLGEDHPSTATCYNNLAALYKSQGRSDEAEPLYKRAVAIHEKVLGDGHPSTAASYNNLAELYKSQGRYDEAEPLYKNDLKISEKVLGKEHPETATSYNNLAGLYTSQGRYDEAEPKFKRAVAIREKVLGEEHPDTAVSYMNLGAFYHKRGKSQEGLELCDKALAILRKALPPGHPTIPLCEKWVKSIRDSIK